jgi:enamine deaminase RidA (YjgF/YER057c/UK114 family)
MGQHSRALELEGHPPLYSPAVISDAGRLAHIAGQVAIRGDGVAHVGDAKGQTQVALENLTEVIKALGADWTDICMLRAYVTKAEDIPAFGEVYAGFIPTPPPASTLVVVQALFMPEVLVEVEAVVALGP